MGALTSAWHCVGRVEDLEEPGAWLRVPLTPAGVLVMRGDDGALRAFHAVCTHRSSALFDADAAETGCAERLTCPYHGLTFDRRGAPSGGPAVVRATGAGPLVAVRLGEALGFVFVTLDAEAPSLDEALGESPPWLRHASGLRLARRVAYDVGASLRIVMENFQESLHFATVHPELEKLTPSARAETWMPSAGAAGPWLGGRMPLADGVETVSVSSRRNGRPWLVPEEERRVVQDAMRAPNLLTSLQPDYLLTFLLFPLGDDRTRVVACTYVAEDAPATGIEDVVAFWSRVHEQDRKACERQQVGIASVGEIGAGFSVVEEGAAAVGRMVAGASTSASKSKKHCGIFGRPYADLSDLLDTSGFEAIHKEITRGLAVVDSGYTGGSLKWMGVCAPWVVSDPYRDAMHAIRAMTRDERAELVALGDVEGEAIDLDDPALAFGDETDRPFSRAQMRFLEQRHGVYFPWKVCYHLLENERWDDKHSGEGKDFSDEARTVFPQTVAFIESLPFVEIGRVVVFGLLANDHAPAHRDSEPGKALALAQSISFEPSRLAGGTGDRHKRFYLATPDGASEVVVDAPVYWFNDMDWHGVHADPFFRYSVRVDGVFDPDFLEQVRRKTLARRRDV